jgi:hypothetical protein
MQSVVEPGIRSLHRREYTLSHRPSSIAHRLSSVASCLLALAVLGVAAMLAPVTVTSAQGAGAEVRFAKPVQVIEDVPLVVGKATVLRIDILAGTQGQARLDISFGSSRKVADVRVNAGGNTVYVPVDPPSAPGTVAISVQATLGGSAGNRWSGVAEAIALQRNWMKVLFMPVDWSNRDRTRFWPGQYNNFVAASSDFFKGTYPFPEGNLTLQTTTSMHMLTAQERAIVDSQGNLNWQAITAMYSGMGVAGRRVMPDADLVVGVLPPGWYARNLNEPNTVGLELHTVRGIVSSQVDADYATLAHEAGHVMNRRDEYNFSIVPPTIGARLDAPGYWIGKSRPIDPGARPTYYSFMGAQDANSQYWVNKDTYMSILRQLQNSPQLGR